MRKYSNPRDFIIWTERSIRVCVQGEGKCIHSTGAFFFLLAPQEVKTGEA